MKVPALVLFSLMFGLLLTSPSLAQKPAFSVAITAVDAQTMKPLKSIRVVPTSYNERAKAVTWQSQYLKTFTSQPATYSMKRGWNLTKLRIESEGYLPYVTKPLKRNTKLELQVKLKPDRGIQGRVLTPDGEPARAAMVAVCTWTNEVTVRDGKLAYGHHAKRLRGMATTKDDASFHLPGEVDEWMLVIAHETGYVQLGSAELQERSTIKLQPWGRLEGDFIIRGKPMSGEAIHIGAGHGGANVVLHYSVGDAKTNDAGVFVAEKLPPVKMYVSPMHKLGDASFNLLWFSGLVEIQPGETTKLSIPRMGQSIQGQFKLPPDSELKMDELDLEVAFYLRPPRISGFAGRGNGQHAAYAQFMQSEQGKAFKKDGIEVAQDGGFRIENMPETSYILTATAFPKADKANAKRTRAAYYSTRVSLPARSEKAALLDLGELMLRPTPPAAR